MVEREDGKIYLGSVELLYISIVTVTRTRINFNYIILALCSIKWYFVRSH
jgi:hypothetical protein